ncbi:DUF5667 domain-containing protein [Modestobacter roseus]|uniref:DUF5667 domain-containing protein n=1 Tax=Modestobacter roseus TaxID=1181884 RepID=A0A562IUK5_9ACTN|nr:DUF5667 domain-containing protein [Modestobacter roseus]MQA33100.1 hypothetical protein [Modestobacter roseus]TWH74443.1 hypothetical protein JD78_02982 [Modestobacter roseus]
MTVQQDDATGAVRRTAGPPPKALPFTPEDLVLARLEGLPAEHAARPDPVFRATTRTRLVAMAAVREPVTRRWGSRRAGASPWRGRITAGLAGATLTVGALGGLLAAAQGAAPGDLLYQVKRGGEATQLVLAGDSSRGATLLAFASARLGELNELAAAGNGAPVVETLRTMDRQTTDGAAWLTARAVADDDAAALRALTSWTAGQRAGLDALADDVPPGADGALDSSRELVAAVADRADALGTALDCPGGPAVAAGDELGPLPAPCPAGAATAQESAGGAPSPSPTGSDTEPAAPGRVAPPVASGATSTPPPAPAEAGAAAPAPAPTPAPAPPPAPAVRPEPAAPAPAATATPSRPRVVVELPPVVPGLRVCLPPVISLDCRPAAD